MNVRANASKFSLNVAERQIEFSRVIYCTERDNERLVLLRATIEKTRITSVVADATHLFSQLEQSLPKFSKSLRDKELSEK